MSRGGKTYILKSVALPLKESAGTIEEAIYLKNMKHKTILIAVCAVLLAIFSLSVDAQRRTTKTPKQPSRKIQSVRINLTEEGYQPSNFRLKKGVPARVTFVRQTEDECGREIVIAAYNIRRTLPLNTPVTVSFTPKKSGTFNFACGMDMLRGKLIVQ